MHGHVSPRGDARLSLLLAGSSLALFCASPRVEKPPPDPYVAEGDLGEILDRGALRVLVPSLAEDDLQRAGAPDVEDREMARAFASRLGVQCEFHFIASRSEILDRLEQGYGDVLMAQLTVTPERRERLRFTRPTAVVDEWLVGRKGEPGLPRKIEDLAGRESPAPGRSRRGRSVHAWKSSSHFETLERWKPKVGPFEDRSHTRGHGVRGDPRSRRTGRVPARGGR